jgi:hypothetical protein
MSSTASAFYKCDACGRTFNSLGELERNRREEHNKLRNDNVDLMAVMKDFIKIPIIMENNLKCAIDR